MNEIASEVLAVMVPGQPMLKLEILNALGWFRRPEPGRPVHRLNGVLRALLAQGLVEKGWVDEIGAVTWTRV